MVVMTILGWAQSAMGGDEVVRCTGTVVDTKDRPIAGANVVAFEMLSDGLAGNIVLEKAGELVTGDDGAFSVAVQARPATGTRFMGGYVVASKDGFALGWEVWDMREDLKATLALGEPATAEGAVVDEGGEPIVGAHVRANLLRTGKTAEGKEKREWLPGLALPGWLENRTDSQGRFAFGHLPREALVDYLITATGRATTYTTELEQDAQARASRSRTGAPFLLPREGRISGRILDPDTDAGVAGARFAVVPTFSGLFYYRFVCTADANGTFTVGGLIAGKHVVRGEGLPRTDVEVRSGETTRITIRANQAWHGRILFQDGEPAVVKPAPWPDAATAIFLTEGAQTPGEKIGQLDDEGYFSVYLSQEQYQRLQSEKAWFHLLIPDRYDSAQKGNIYKLRTVFAVDLLSRDKATAGIARVVGPEREPTSLLDRPLPPFDQLGLAGLNERAAGKTVLLCFLDMQQRPSRNCLRQLAARAQELQAQGVVIAAVQASKVDQAELDRWMREAGITFPIGAIPGEADKTRFAWGVQSLPWLILAGKDHVVKGEGFGLDELGKRMEKDR
ncbi:MAG: hypothetical protein A2Y77_13955 [Planctomycetes bacterium RBG_13_62_9]|nr:MAG: hypothetical protein A2Y77_13955 [Planctomycetes bacterium RBG_13_62_9]